MIFAFGALLLKYGLQSRCIKCSICYGLIAVERDPQAENVELQEQLEHSIITAETSYKPIFYPQPTYSPLQKRYVETALNSPYLK